MRQDFQLAELVADSNRARREGKASPCVKIVFLMRSDTAHRAAGTGANTGRVHTDEQQSVTEKIHIQLHSLRAAKDALLEVRPGPYRRRTEFLHQRFVVQHIASQGTSRKAWRATIFKTWFLILYQARADLVTFPAKFREVRDHRTHSSRNGCGMGYAFEHLWFQTQLGS